MKSANSIITTNFTQKRGIKKSSIPLFEGIIYKYTDKLNGKVYIGQTIHERVRKWQHSKALGNSIFHNAIKSRGGINNFEYKVLFRIKCRYLFELGFMLDQKEIIAIKYFDSTNPEKGYNYLKGGQFNGGRRGKLRDGDKKQKQYENLRKINSKAVVRLSMDWEYIEEYSSSQEASDTLKTVSRVAINSNCNGRTYSCMNSHWVHKDKYELYKSDISVYQKELMDKKGRANSKGHRIVQLSKNGKQFIKIWENQREASKSLGIAESYINRALTGVRKNNITKDFSWMYWEDWYELNKSKG